MLYFWAVNQRLNRKQLFSFKIYIIKHRYVKIIAEKLTLHSTYCEIPVQSELLFQDLENQFGNQYEKLLRLKLIFRRTSCFSVLNKCVFLNKINYKMKFK